MSKPGKSLRNLCKKLGVRLTVKRGKKRVYKSVKVLKGQCSKKKRRRRKFGTKRTRESLGEKEAAEGLLALNPSRKKRRIPIKRKGFFDNDSGPDPLYKEPNKPIARYNTASIYMDKGGRRMVGIKSPFSTGNYGPPSSAFTPKGTFKEYLEDMKKTNPYSLTNEEREEKKRLEAKAYLRYQKPGKFGKKKKVSRKKGPSATLKKLCKKLGVRLTVKRGKKRVYKSEKVLKKQCTKKRRRKFGDRTTLQRTNPQTKKVVKRNPIDFNNPALRYYRPKIQKAFRDGVPLDIIRGALIVDHFKWNLHSRYNPIARKLQRLLDKKKLTHREYEAIQSMYAMLYKK